MAGDCYREACRCTHTCEYGWLELEPSYALVRNPNGGEPTRYARERVAPCPICRPEAYTRYEQKLLRESRNVA